ncbi:hypothetical protein D3C76_1220010 [compost metagenome]
MLAIALAVRQVEGNAHPGLRLGVFDLQARQFVASKAPPEANQHQGNVPPAAQQGGQVLAGGRLLRLTFQPLDGLFQVLQEQGRRLLFLGRMQGADALDHLPHRRRFGGIREALGDVPLGEGSQTLLQRADGMLVGVLGEVTHDAVAGRRQKPTPGHFEVFHCRAIAAPGVVPGAGLQIAIRLVHLDPST